MRRTWNWAADIATGERQGRCAGFPKNPQIEEPSGDENRHHQGPAMKIAIIKARR
jgi:hypothetical protein